MSDAPYVFNRDSLASVRLYFQHWMWRYQTGFLLHPQIPTTADGLKIADVACGTGIWLIELARTVPASAQLDGYDISASQFPPKQWLPPNVTLQTSDALGPVPEALRGQYDIVHVGLVVMLIRNEDPAPLLTNLMAMLKPGGYLHWDEAHTGSMRASCADPSMAHPCWDKLDAAVGAWRLSRGLTYRWLDEMDKLFEQHQLSLVSQQRLPISDEIKKPWTDMQLMGTREIVENVIIPASGEASASSPSAEEWREMFQNLTIECQQGTSITMDMITVVGRKAT